MFGLFKRNPESSPIKLKDPEGIFWDWFHENKKNHEKFIDSNKSDTIFYPIKLKVYNNLLSPELTKTNNGEYVLIVTPNGIKDDIEPTQKLAEAHPDLKNWIIKKFRQPRDEVTLNFKGLTYPSTDISIIPERHPIKEKINIKVK